MNKRKKIIFAAIEFFRKCYYTSLFLWRINRVKNNTLFLNFDECTKKYCRFFLAIL